MPTFKFQPLPHVQHNAFYNVFWVPDTNTNMQVYTPKRLDTGTIASYTFEDFVPGKFIARENHILCIKENLNLKWPNPLQSIALSILLKDGSTKNCLIQGKPGTGKTSCSILPILAICNFNLDSFLSQGSALYVVASREAMNKVSDMLKKALPSIRVHLLEQHVSTQDILPDVIIGTPDRISAWVHLNTQHRSKIQIVVFNELDLIFKLENAIETSRSFRSLLKAECRVMLMSASINRYIKDFAKSINGLEWLFVDKEQCYLSRSTLLYERVPSELQKFGKAMKEIKSWSGNGQAVIVMNQNNMPLMFEAIQGQCNGICAPEVGSLAQGESRSFQEFKTGKAEVLITSHPHMLDWRFDQSEVKLVIIYDVPTHDQAVDPYTLYSSWVGLATDKVLVLVCGDMEENTLKLMETTLGYVFCDDSDDLFWAL